MELHETDPEHTSEVVTHGTRHANSKDVVVNPLDTFVSILEINQKKFQYRECVVSILEINQIFFFKRNIITKTFVILLPPYENENKNKNMNIIG